MVTINVKFDGHRTYRGDWTADGTAVEGFGALTNEEGDQLYEGYMKNNRMEGRGRLITDDGTVYEGFWKADQLNGKCKIIQSDGIVYIGNFVDDRKHGQESWNP